MIRLARILTAPFLMVPVVLLLITHGEDAAHDFLDSVDRFFDALQ